MNNNLRDITSLQGSTSHPLPLYHTNQGIIAPPENAKANFQFSLSMSLGMTGFRSRPKQQQHRQAAILPAPLPPPPPQQQQHLPINLTAQLNQQPTGPFALPADSRTTGGTAAATTTTTAAAVAATSSESSRPSSQVASTRGSTRSRLSHFLKELGTHSRHRDEYGYYDSRSSNSTRIPLSSRTLRPPSSRLPPALPSPSPPTLHTHAQRRDTPPHRVPPSSSSIPLPAPQYSPYRPPRDLSVHGPDRFSSGPPPHPAPTDQSRSSQVSPYNPPHSRSQLYDPFPKHLKARPDIIVQPMDVKHARSPLSQHPISRPANVIQPENTKQDHYLSAPPHDPRARQRMVSSSQPQLPPR